MVINDKLSQAQMAALKDTIEEEEEEEDSAAADSSLCSSSACSKPTK
jgi:hypothetical protein